MCPKIYYYSFSYLYWIPILFSFWPLVFQPSHASGTKKPNLVIWYALLNCLNVFGISPPVSTKYFNPWIKFFKCKLLFTLMVTWGSNNYFVKASVSLQFCNFGLSLVWMFYKLTDFLGKFLAQKRKLGGSTVWRFC